MTNVAVGTRGAKRERRVVAAAEVQPHLAQSEEVEVIDEERQKEIYQYFREAETDSAEVALKELGEADYTLEEMRLMRIKFMSEMAN